MHFQLPISYLVSFGDMQFELMTSSLVSFGDMQFELLTSSLLSFGDMQFELLTSSLVWHIINNQYWFIYKKKEKNIHQNTALMLLRTKPLGTTVVNAIRVRDFHIVQFGDY
jgi:RNase P/RNase MRP subunit POP5